MNDPELDGGAGDLGTVFVQPAPVQVKEKAVQVPRTALPPFLRSGGEGFPASGMFQSVEGPRCEKDGTSALISENERGRQK